MTWTITEIQHGRFGLDHDGIHEESFTAVELLERVSALIDPKLPPAQWLAMHDPSLEIIDCDGWVNQAAFETPCTESEFKARVAKCTMRWTP